MRIRVVTSMLCFAVLFVGCTWAWESQTRSQVVLKGLESPALVSDRILVRVDGVPSGSTVKYLIDGNLTDLQTNPPYWMGGLQGGLPTGFSLARINPGPHRLQAIVGVGAAESHSDAVALTVIPSISHIFSSKLGSYRIQTGSAVADPDQAFVRTGTSQVTLPSSEQAVRREVFDMYYNWGIDLSIDAENFRSQRLFDAAPTGWMEPVQDKPENNRERVSPDSPFYQKIPAVWPRIALPAGYLKTVQVNSTQGGDGIGYGIAYSGPADPNREIVSQWYDMVSTRATYLFRIPPSWPTQLPWQEKGDRHMIFIDNRAATFVSTYKTSAEGNGNVRALFANKPTSFNSLGDRGGSNAAGFAELPLLIRKGELTDKTRPLGHAIGGPVHRTWMARVFPASGWDYGIESSKDSCTGVGYTNTGLVPYGGIIQLDPHVDLKRLALTLPALRILEAMQQYGYYVMDYGCADFDIYTSISESELNPFGGLWGGNHLGVGVQNEVKKVLLESKLYVVPPVMRKE